MWKGGNFPSNKLLYATEVKVKYLLFIFLVFSLDLAASESFTFTEKVSSECKGEALDAEKFIAEKEVELEEA